MLLDVFQNVSRSHQCRSLTLTSCPILIMPWATDSMLDALASVEWFPEVAPAPPLDSHVKTIGPSADGRCFFSCCYLWCSTNSEKRRWAEVERNGVGFPLDAERLKEEAMERVL